MYDAFSTVAGTEFLQMVPAYLKESNSCLLQIAGNLEKLTTEQRNTIQAIAEQNKLLKEQNQLLLQMVHIGRTGG